MYKSKMHVHVCIQLIFSNMNAIEAAFDPSPSISQSRSALYIQFDQPLKMYANLSREMGFKTLEVHLIPVVRKPSLEIPVIIHLGTTDRSDRLLNRESWRKCIRYLRLIAHHRQRYPTYLKPGNLIDQDHPQPAHPQPASTTLIFCSAPVRANAGGRVSIE